MSKPFSCVCAIGLLVILLGPSAHGRVIDRYHFAPASATTDVSTPSPNNDNATSASPNQIVFPSNYPGSTFNSLNPLDTVFLVSPSSGATEYFLSQSVFNNTGLALQGLTLQIGSGIDSNFQIGGGIVVPEIVYPDFDIPTRDPAPTASAFPQVNSSIYQLQFSGGTLAPGNVVAMSMTFSIDVPNDLSGNGYSQFTLRTIPVAVPEPASLVLMGFTGAALVLLRRRPTLEFACI